MLGPGFDVLLIAHVGVGLAGFGALGFTGINARDARELARAVEPAQVAGAQAGGTSDLVFQVRDPRLPRLRRYFAPRMNVAERLIYLVPLLGIALALGTDGPSELAEGWLLCAASLWVIAIVCAHGVIWPAEASLQRLFHPEEKGASEVREDLDGDRREAIAAHALRAERGVAVAEMAYVVAFALMVWQPH